MTTRRRVARVAAIGLLVTACTAPAEPAASTPADTAAPGAGTAAPARPTALPSGSPEAPRLSPSIEVPPPQD